MTPEQIALVLKHRLLTRTWTGGSERVFPFQAVKVTNNPERQAFLAMPVPQALIIIGDFQADPTHSEEPGYLVGTIVVKLGVAHQDSMGEAASIGSNKVGGVTSSKGRGLGEVGSELLATIEKMNLIDGISIQSVARGNSQSIPVTEGGYRATKDYAFEVVATSQPEYSEPYSLQVSAPGAGAVNLSWGNPAAVAGQALLLTRKAGGTPPATPSDGTALGVGALATSYADAPGAGQWSYTLWMSYTESGIVTLSPPIAVTIIAT